MKKMRKGSKSKSMKGGTQTLFSNRVMGGKR